MEGPASPRWLDERREKRARIERVSGGGEPALQNRVSEVSQAREAGRGVGGAAAMNVAHGGAQDAYGSGGSSAAIEIGRAGCTPLAQLVDGGPEMAVEGFWNEAMQVSEWQHLREVAFLSGDETALLAYKVLQEMLLSPRIGVDESLLEGLSKEVGDTRQFWDGDSQQIYTRVSQAPDGLADGLARGRVMYSKRLMGGAKVFPIGDSAVDDGRADGQSATSRFVDNVQYVFEHLVGGDFSGLKDRKVDKSLIMRGRIPELSCYPRTERENGVMDVDSIVLYDPLFRRLFLGGA